MGNIFSVLLIIIFFIVGGLTEAAMPKDVSEYSHLDPSGLIKPEALTRAVRFYKKYKPYVYNQNYMTLIDMSQHASKKRMYLVNMKTGLVTSYLTAHGKNSDLNNDGYADKFSNINGSLMTSLGFYFTGTTYTGKHGLSLHLHGLQTTNNLAYERAIVMHGADYVNPDHVGRSFGCPAIERRYIKNLLPALSGGSLLLIF